MSRLLSPESKDLTGTAMRKSHCPSWQTPLPRAAADAVGLMERVRDVIGEGALLEEPRVVLGEGGQREEQKRE
jgi:hypothetical protein